MVNVINNGEIQENGFIVRAQGVALTQQGRRSFIAAYERRLDQEVTHPVYGYKITYRRVLEVQARMLGAYFARRNPRLRAVHDEVTHGTRTQEVLGGI